MKYLAEDLGIAQNYQAVLGTSESDVESSRIVEETNSLVLVGAHARDNDVVLFTTLERIYTGDFDFFVKLLLQRSVELHEAYDVGSLPFVRRNDANLTWKNARFEETGNNFFDIRSFCSDAQMGQYSGISDRWDHDIREELLTC